MSIDTTVFSLSAPDISLEFAGGKGFALSKLVQAGFSVPAGYIISTRAYCDFIEQNNLKEEIADLVDRDLIEREQLESTSKKIFQLFERKDISDNLKESILSAYKAISVDRDAVAVRSSATAEDLPDMSFAGQQDSFLNVWGEDELLATVKKCWASLWSARAIGYRNRMEIDHGCLAMAVVVQRMITSDVSGVLFTVNPTSGDRDQMVVNASFGLGEAIVGGQVDPDSFTWNRISGKTEDVQLRAKEIMVVGSSKGGTVEEAVAEKKCNVASLQDSSIKELASICEDIEALFLGVPQDIEFALSNEKVWILQSRPITNLPIAPLKDVVWEPLKEGDKYIRRQVVENMPGPLSPLFDELYLTQGLEKSISQVMKKMEMDFDYSKMIEPPMFLTLNGYAYCKASYKMPLTMIPKIFYIYFFTIGDLLKRVIPLWRDQGLPDYLCVVENAKSINIKEASDSQLLKNIKTLTFADAVYWFDVAMLIGAAKVTDGMLNAFLSSNMVNSNLTSGSILRGFTSKMFSAQTDLEEIAKKIHQSDELVKLVNRTKANRLLETLEFQPIGKPILKDICSYLEKYGHQIYSLDFVEPTQAEDPVPVLLSLKALVESGVFNAASRQKELAKERDEKIREAIESFSFTSKPIFKLLLQWANTYAPYREEALFYMGAAWPTLRKMALELGGRLVDIGTISKASNVFFLTSAEIETACKAREDRRAVPELGKLAKQRFELREARKKLHPPGMVPLGSEFKFGPFNMSVFETQKRNSDDSYVLDGFAVSPGKVTGIASLILSPEDFENMQPDSILVCPTTTPAWTPLFIQARALVTDIGGILAHGSIVAREYGIPSVMGTGNATKRIKSGQKITVDGDTGKVTIHD